MDPLQGAVAALQTVVTEGVSDDTISEKAAEEIGKRLGAALEKFADGDTEGAIDELQGLEEKVDDLVDDDEIANSEEQKLDKAIEDLAEQMFFASSDDG